MIAGSGPKGQEQSAAVPGNGLTERFQVGRVSRHPTGEGRTGTLTTLSQMRARSFWFILLLRLDHGPTGRSLLSDHGTWHGGHSP